MSKAARELAVKLAANRWKVEGCYDDAQNPSDLIDKAVAPLVEAARRLFNLANNHHSKSKDEWFTSDEENFDAMLALEKALEPWRKS